MPRQTSIVPDGRNTLRVMITCATAILAGACGPGAGQRSGARVRDVHAGSSLPPGGVPGLAPSTALYFSQVDPGSGKGWAYHAFCPAGLTPNAENCADWDAMPLGLFTEQLTAQSGRDLLAARAEEAAFLKGVTPRASGASALDARGKAAALETIRARIRDIESRQETEQRLLAKMSKRTEMTDVPLLIRQSPWEARFEALVMKTAADVFRTYVLQPLVRGPWIYTLLPRASTIAEARNECEWRRLGAPAFGASVSLTFTSKAELDADSAQARADAADLFTNPTAHFTIRASHGTKCLTVREGEALISLPRPNPVGAGTSGGAGGRPLSGMRAVGGLSGLGLDRFNNPVNRIGRAFNGGNSRVFVNTGGPSLFTEAPQREFTERVNDLLDFSQGTQPCGRDAVTRQELTLVVCRQAR